MIGIDHKRLGDKQMKSEFDKSTLHCKYLLVMNWVGLFCSFELSRLKRNDTLSSLNIRLQQITAYGNVR